MPTFEISEFLLGAFFLVVSIVGFVVAIRHGGWVGGLAAILGLVPFAYGNFLFFGYIIGH